MYEIKMDIQQYSVLKNAELEQILFLVLGSKQAAEWIKW